MLYRLLQWISGIALHWYYREVVVVHREKLPGSGPMVVAVNHPNALVDTIVAQWVVPRRLRITAKSTLANTLPGALLMKAVGVILLRRRSDEPSGPQDPMRNREALRTVVDALKHGEAVLIFPEGKSHNEPVVAPLKMGLAHMALRAREAGVRGIHIVPIGLTFEDKSCPDTTVVAQVGEVIALDEWQLDDPSSLTAAIADRLGRVALTEDILRGATGVRQKARRSRLMTLAARWGHVVHTLPIRAARRVALARSTSPDEPAMYTMVYGLAFTIVTYAIQLPIVWKLWGGVAALGYFALLLTGAYWAAYGPHPSDADQNARSHRSI